jgi:hypothetical protein
MVAAIAELFGSFGSFCRSLSRREELEQPAIFRAGVLIKQPEQNGCELGAGIFGGMFER